MKKLALIALGTLLAFAATVSASEVAEAAKKERARRASIQKERKSGKVFTNQDVADLKSTLAFESKPAAESEETAQPADETTPPPPVEQAEDQRNREREEEIEKLKQEREQLEQQAKQAQDTIDQGGGYHTRNMGNQYKTKREAESRIREIDQKLQETEQKDEEQE